MRDLRGARDRQHHRAALEQPGERDLARGRAVDLAMASRIVPGLREIARGERKPGDEADAVRLAVIQHVFAGAIDEIVAVLHRRDREHLRRGLDLGDRDLAQPGVTDDASSISDLDGVELLVARHLRVDAVQLPQPDLLDAELVTALARFGARYSGRPSGSHCPVRNGSARPWWRRECRHKDAAPRG